MTKADTLKSKAARRDDDVQIIRSDSGAPLYAVMAWADYQRLTAVDGETAALIAAGMDARDDEVYPEEVARRLLAGEPPLKVIREWRGLTQEDLADRSHVATQYISQIERGVRNVGRNVGAKLADILNVSREMLMDL
ncbi:MAG TPA: helix-turn-helix transcriptional regulator [Rhizomicrobium sp.]|nr:helix-turn-helix transcriptional regulator [Rhizomicrobium sp.]